MHRRGFVLSLGGAIAAWPIGAHTQQADRPRRIGVLQPQRESDQEAQSWVGAFRLELEKLGWREGDNIQIDYFWYGGNLDRLRTYAERLASLLPDVIFCMSTPTVAALQKATRTVPIVFVNANNPVGDGFVASLARPGGNTTGFVAYEPDIGGKWLEVLKEIAPGVTRVAQVYNPKTHTGQYFGSIEAASHGLSVNPVRVPFADAAELERGINAFAREPNGGLIVLPDTSTRVHRDLIVRLAAAHRMPAVYSYRLFITSGGLAYYGTNTTDQFKHAAAYVDRILKGAKPAELPVQAPTRFELVVNVRTAKALGLTIPPSVLIRADEVIE
jgi:putative ABC transport system substrate-binding protein